MPSTAPDPFASNPKTKRGASRTDASSASPTAVASAPAQPAEQRDFELTLHDLHPAPDDMRGDILAGLRATPRTLPCKYFYDERGSAIFDAICELDEYYPTRTETAILEQHAAEMAAAMGQNALVIELGSGSSTKTPLLLGALEQAAGYVPIDISREHLLGAAGRIRDRFSGLPVWPVCADFTAPLDLPTFDVAPAKRFVFFPGSTMGNFDPAGRRELLHKIVSLCAPEGGGLLIGLDLLKDRETLEAAYNDSRGTTADFNLNLLERVNRELSANFDLAGFDHHAPFNADEGRIEMHLVSRRDQTVAIGDVHFDIGAGERICTEHSHKFSLETFAGLAAEVGLEQKAVWTDADRLFAVALFETSSTG